LLETSAEVDEGELAAALDDDFNTPEALAVLHRWRGKSAGDQVRRGLELFGIRPLQPTAPALVQGLAEERVAARTARDFDRADELRRQIEAHGWEIRDVERGYQLVPK